MAGKTLSLQTERLSLGDDPRLNSTFAVGIDDEDDCPDGRDSAVIDQTAPPDWLQVHMALRQRQWSVQRRVLKLGHGSLTHEKPTLDNRNVHELQRSLSRRERGVKPLPSRRLPRLTKRHGHFDPMKDRALKARGDYVTVNTKHGKYLICKDIPSPTGFPSASPRELLKFSHPTFPPSESVMSMPEFKTSPIEDKYQPRNSAHVRRINRENTDYEPIEAIARRNNLNIFQQLEYKIQQDNGTSKPVSEHETDTYLHVRVGQKSSMKLKLPPIQDSQNVGNLASPDKDSAV